MPDHRSDQRATERGGDASGQASGAGSFLDDDGDGIVLQNSLDEL